MEIFIHVYKYVTNQLEFLYLCFYKFLYRTMRFDLRRHDYFLLLDPNIRSDRHQEMKENKGEEKKGSVGN